MEERLERVEEAWSTFIIEFPACPRMLVDGVEDYQKILFLCSASERNPAELCFALFGPKILLRQCQRDEEWANVPGTRLIFVYAAETPPALRQTLAHYQSRLNTPVLVAQKSNVHKTAQHVIEFLSKATASEESAPETAEAGGPDGGLVPRPAAEKLWVGPLPEIELRDETGHQVAASAAIQDYRAEFACRYVLAHYREDINRDRMAEAVHLSPGYFSNLFRSEVKMSFSDYLIQVRIENAKRLLRRFDLSVEAISKECGFHSLAHFSRTFKDRCGVAPLKYRKNPVPPSTVA
ncbi:MAG: helix-turn-helix transcriptional regulator [Candidatus Krumholzibacteriia bacterium]